MIRITQKVNKVSIIQNKLVVKQAQRPIDNIRIDRVILREKEVLNSDNFYNKEEIDSKLNSKQDINSYIYGGDF